MGAAGCLTHTPVFARWTRVSRQAIASCNPVPKGQKKENELPSLHQRDCVYGVYANSAQLRNQRNPQASGQCIPRGTAHSDGRPKLRPEPPEHRILVRVGDSVRKRTIKHAERGWRQSSVEARTPQHGVVSVGHFARSRGSNGRTLKGNAFEIELVQVFDLRPVSRLRVLARLNG